jgi:hypothetical protein
MPKGCKGTTFFSNMFFFGKKLSEYLVVLYFGERNYGKLWEISVFLCTFVPYNKIIEHP